MCVCVCAGVLMWEVLTRGRMPFEQSPNHQVVLMVSQGQRLHRPKMATAAIYHIMLRCWHEVLPVTCFLLPVWWPER